VADEIYGEEQGYRHEQPQQQHYSQPSQEQHCYHSDAVSAKTAATFTSLEPEMLDGRNVYEYGVTNQPTTTSQYSWHPPEAYQPAPSKASGQEWDTYEERRITSNTANSYQNHVKAGVENYDERSGRGRVG